MSAPANEGSGEDLNAWLAGMAAPEGAPSGQWQCEPKAASSSQAPGDAGHSGDEAEDEGLFADLFGDGDDMATTTSAQPANGTTVESGSAAMSDISGYDDAAQETQFKHRWVGLVKPMCKLCVCVNLCVCVWVGVVPQIGLGGDGWAIKSEVLC